LSSPKDKKSCQTPQIIKRSWKKLDFFSNKRLIPGLGERSLGIVTFFSKKSWLDCHNPVPPISDNPRVKPTFSLTFLPWYSTDDKERFFWSRATFLKGYCQSFTLFDSRLFVVQLFPSSAQALFDALNWKYLHVLVLVFGSNSAKKMFSFFSEIKICFSRECCFHFLLFRHSSNAQTQNKLTPYSESSLEDKKRFLQLTLS